MQELNLQVKQVIGSMVGISADEIQDWNTLTDDLDMDSLMLVQLGLDLENTFNIELPDSSIRAAMTVGDVIGEVNRLLQPAA